MSLKRLAELRDQRNNLITQARSLLDKAETEKRNLSEEEARAYDTILTDQGKVLDEIKRVERQIELDKEMASSSVTDQRQSGQSQENRQSSNPRETDEYRDMFFRFLAGGKSALSHDEFRALSAGSAPDGGYTVAPMEMAQGIIKAVDNEVIIRGKATKFPLAKATSLGAVSLDSDPDDPTWTSEIKTGNEDSSMAFGRRELSPHPVARRIKVSNKLLSVSAIAIEQLIRDRFAYKLGIVQEKAFMTGSGAQQPLGLFTASAFGINTDRDVSTDNTATEMTFDGLQNAKYSLKAQYQRTAEWIFHRDGVKQLAKIKDGDGQYIWQPAVTANTPDMLLGRPVNQSEYCPNTFTTGLYVGMFGDFSYYWIADALDIQFQVLKELYAETNQTGYICRLECDGMPVLSEAFARVKLG